LAHQINENFVIGMRNEEDIQPADHVNHSCDPNCGFKGQIRLVTMRDISVGEEITFDYAMVLCATKENGLQYEMNCRCGSKNCRKFVTADDWKSLDLQKKYHGYFQEYLTEKIQDLS
jgi:hypothetical protein